MIALARLRVRGLLLAGIGLAAPAVFAQEVATPAPPSVPEVASPVPVRPQRVEVTLDAAPVQMRQQDAELLLQQIRQQHPTQAPEPKREHRNKTKDRLEKRNKRNSAGGTPAELGDTVQLPQPDVVNTSGVFLYHDVTDRSQALPPRLSLDERRDAVEAYRRSLPKRREVPQTDR